MKKPNILCFFTDQQRGDSIYPYERAISPNVTKFCKEGLVFSQAHTIAPHCCPSRATFFSGLYPTQHGVWNNVSVGNTLSKGLFEGVRLFPEDIKDAGYRTYYGGKWHVSDYENATHRGFDVVRLSRLESRNSLGHRAPNQREWDNYIGHKEAKERLEGQIIRRGYDTYTHYGVDEAPKNDQKVIDDAIDIILNRSEIDKGYYNENKANEPWFQIVAPVGPHDPYVVPQKYLDMYDIDDIQLPENFKDTMEDKPALYRRTRDRFDQLTEREHREAIRHYLAYCTYEDDLFGQVLNALDKSGEAEETLVLYFSDHGDYMAEHGLWCKGLPCFEGAYHIPAAIRWPKGLKNPGRIIDDFISLADFAPTFLEICGIDVDRKMMGHSLTPYLKDEKPEFVQDALFTQSNGNELYGIQRSVKTKEWKYVYNGYDYDEFYDLTKDPDEMVNVMDTYKDSEVLKDMSIRLWKFLRDTGDVCINQYIMVALASYGPGIIYEELSMEEN